MSRLAAGLLAALAIAAPAAAQTAPTPGRWAPWVESGTTADVPAASVAALRAQSETILSTMFRAAPVLGDPDASWWGLRVRSVGRREDAVWTEGQGRWPLSSGFYASVIRASQDDAGRTRWEPTEVRRSIGMGVETNSLRCVFPSQHQPFYQDAQGPIYEQPGRTGEVGGFPVYNGDCLAITARAQPLFLPATRERVARIVLARTQATLADFDRGIAEARKAGVPQAATELQGARDAHARAVAQWQATLAGLSPVQRNAPAYLRIEATLVGDTPVAQPFADAPGENIIALTYPNPAFFDLTRPTAIQLITIGLSETGPLGCSHPGCEPADQAFFEQFAAQMDWNALAALTTR